MSYSIYIGEATLFYDAEDGIVCVEVAPAKGGPVFPGDKLTGGSNARHPGYTQWGDFCQRTGLHALFFDGDEGLMRHHPGAVPLTEDHHTAVQLALFKLQKKGPPPPGWCECRACNPWDKIDVPHVDLDGDLAQLLWLDHWMGWALKNCSKPTIYNH